MDNATMNRDILQGRIYNTALGTVLRKERRDQDMQQHALAKRTGMKQTQIASYETGRVGLKAFKFREICKVLRVDMNTMDERAMELINKTKQEIGKDNATINN